MSIYSARFGFFAGFVVPWFLLAFNFVDQIDDLSTETNLLIIMAVASYLLGDFFVYVLGGERSVKRSLEPVLHEHKEKSLVTLLFAWFIIGFGCLSFEFYSIGSIPVLAGSDWEFVRFGLQVNGYIHLLAISTGFVAVISFASWHFSTNAKYKKFYIYLIVLSIGAMILTGNRSDFLLPMVIAAVFYLMSSNVKFSLLGAIKILLFILAFGLIKLLREELSGVEYVEMMKGQMTQVDANWFYVLIYPVYMTVAYNFSILDRLVAAGAAGASSGEYTFYSLYSLFASDKINYGDFKNYLLGIDFYGELTSTYISNFYIDFGVYGVVIGSFVLGLMNCYFYIKSLKDGRFTIVYSLMFVYLLVSFYCFMYYYFYSVLQVVILLMYAIVFLKKKEV